MAIKVVDEMSKEELIQYISDFRKAMLDHIGDLEKENSKLKKELEDHVVNEKDLQLQLRIAEEKYKKLIAAKFQSQKNQIVLDMPTLFDDIEEESLKVEDSELEEVITVGEHKRVRRPKEKHIDYSNLDRIVEKTIEIPEGEDICPVCGTKMHIKRYEEKEELVVIPQKVYIRVTKIPVLECTGCQESNLNAKSTCKTVTHPNFLLPRSKVSPELLAYIIDMKYNCGLPLYTIEKMFQRLGVTIPRQNMSNWVIGVTGYLERLFNLMKKDLIESPVIMADETTTQVLNEDGRPATSTSYMWVYRIPRCLGKIVLYDYQPSRSGEKAKEFLKGFTGYLESDKFGGYNKVENIIRCLCNMHALKNFKEAYKLLPNTKERQKSDEAKAIKKYQAIFHEENLIQEDASKKYSEPEKRFEYIKKRREIKLKPMFESFFSWLEEIQSRNAGKYTMSQSINYVLNDREGFIRFIEDGKIPISNQESEQCIKPFVVIRNRCKFYVSTTGAHVSAMIYSIVITCIENNINPYTYFTYIFEKMPNMNLDDSESLRELLPYSNSLPSYTKIMSKSEIKAILKKEKK